MLYLISVIFFTWLMGRIGIACMVGALTLFTKTKEKKMKLEQPINEPKLDNIELQAAQQQEKKLTYIGSLLPHNGHKCFEYNTKTGDITEAIYAKQDIHYPTGNTKAGIKRKVIVNADCIYVTALNKKNALKKINQ